jgi:hypothetical protein
MITLVIEAINNVYRLKGVGLVRIYLLVSQNQFITMHQKAFIMNRIDLGFIGIFYSRWIILTIRLCELKTSNFGGTQT